MGRPALCLQQLGIAAYFCLFWHSKAQRSIPGPAHHKPHNRPWASGGAARFSLQVVFRQACLQQILRKAATRWRSAALNAWFAKNVSKSEGVVAS